MTNKIGVICAHPDDEVLGCGGTMARLADSGHEVHVLVLGEGATSRSPLGHEEGKNHELDMLRRAALAAAKVLGAQSVAFGGFPDNRMVGMNLLDIVKRVERFLAERQIHTVMTHHRGDLNIDHQIVHRAVHTACRPLPGSTTQTLLCFEVPSSTEWSIAQPFHPNWHEDIEHTLARKLEALQCYEMEMRPWPHPRSYQGVEALARWRGASVGKQAAEAFELSRLVR